MKKKILISAAIIFGIFLVSLPFTKYRIDETIKPLSLPESITDLDSYLAKSEAQFNDIVPGAEKKLYGHLRNMNRPNFQ